MKQYDLIDGIDCSSFCPSTRIKDLQLTNCEDVPTQKGVYLIIRYSLGKPNFLEKSVGGYYKGLYPSYRKDDVVSNWVDGARVLYVGKASGKKGLRQRLRQFVQFGLGKPVAHRGGRLIWHLKDNQDLTVRWFESGDRDPEEVETTLIKIFKDVHRGKRPFANLQK